MARLAADKSFLVVMALCVVVRKIFPKAYFTSFVLNSLCVYVMVYIRSYILKKQNTFHSLSCHGMCWYTGGPGGGLGNCRMDAGAGLLAVPAGAELDGPAAESILASWSTRSSITLLDLSCPCVVGLTLALFRFFACVGTNTAPFVS